MSGPPSSSSGLWNIHRVNHRISHAVCGTAMEYTHVNGRLCCSSYLSAASREVISLPSSTLCGSDSREMALWTSSIAPVWEAMLSVSYCPGRKGWGEGKGEGGGRRAEGGCTMNDEVSEQH